MISSIKSVRTLGLAGLMVAVALMVVASVGVASSSAAEWGECFSQAGGAYKDGLCTEKTGGSFEWEAFTSAVAIKSEGTLELTDAKGGGGGGSVTVTCTGKDEGTVGPGAQDKVTAVFENAAKKEPEEWVKCTHTAGEECGSPRAHAVHIPWNTKLEGSPVRDKIESGGTGAPGWIVECTVFFVKVTDECTGTTTTSVTNVAGGVDTTFDASSANANCTRGGAGAGKVRGTNHVLNPAGVQLSVK